MNKPLVDPDATDHDTPLTLRQNELALEGWGIPYYATISNSQTRKFIDRIIQHEASVAAARALSSRWHGAFNRYQEGDDFSIIDASDDCAHELDNALNGAPRFEVDK